MLEALVAYWNGVQTLESTPNQSWTNHLISLHFNLTDKLGMTILTVFYGVVINIEELLNETLLIGRDKMLAVTV